MSDREKLADCVRQYMHRRQTQKRLDHARRAILEANEYSYEEQLRRIVQDALKCIREELPACNLASYHFSSLALRRWLRITPPEVWATTAYTGSEVHYFTSIYEWDTRAGHVMTDPDMPDDLYACFGARVAKCNRTKSKDSHIETCDIAVPTSKWCKAFELVRAKAFPVLVSHDLDPCEDEACVLGELKRQSGQLRDVKKKEEDFATNLIALGAAVKALAPHGTVAVSSVIAARSFLLSFYYTIGRQLCSKSLPVEQVVTASFSPLHFRTNGQGKEKSGALALVFRSADEKRVEVHSDDIRPATEVLTRTLVEMEHRALFDRVHDSTVTIGEEDLLRRACEIDVSEGKGNDFPHDRIAALSLPLHQTIAELLVDRRFPGHRQESTREKSCDVIRKGTHKEVVGELTRLLGSPLDSTVHTLLSEFKLVGVSHVYRQLVRDIAAAAMADDMRETRLLFLDSEPGCGKEHIAKLVHLLSPRGHLDVTFWEDDKPNDLLRAARDHKDELDIGNRDEGYVQFRSLKAQARVKTKGRPVATVEIPTWRLAAKAIPRSDTKANCGAYTSARLFNYFTVNMATLHNGEHFNDVLFGRYKEGKLVRLGRCLLAHALSGTVFCDEFNTLPLRDQANAFLRLLDKPYEMEISGRPSGPLSKVNMLVIFASNRTREALIEAGFNEAVVYRVTKNRIRIPALRERPVDIAVFVNSLVRQHNERQVERGGKDTQIHRVALPAMRLLCELRWPDNYRGVQGLMDDVLGDRVRRKIKHRELMFEEILHGLRRREAFQAAVSRGKTESPQHSTLK